MEFDEERAGLISGAIWKWGDRDAAEIVRKGM